MPDIQQIIDLHFPAAGLNLSHAYDAQPNSQTQDGEYSRTAAIGENVCSFDTRTDRQRGGSRPCLKKQVAGQVSGTNLIQYLGSIPQTSGTRAGSGTTVQQYTAFRYTPLALSTFSSLDGIKTEAATTAATGMFYGNQTCRAFVSGGSNQSYTTLDIADGSGVAVTMGLGWLNTTGAYSPSSTDVAKYIMVVNGRRIASTPATLPGTLPDFTTAAVASGTYHYAVFLQTGASVGKLGACAIDDSGTIVWSAVDGSSVVTTSELLAGSFYGTALSAAIAGTYLLTYVPGLTGLVRCLVADGTSGSVINTRASIAAQAGGNYVPQAFSSYNQGIAATTGGRVAVVVYDPVANAHGLVYITASTGAYPISATTGYVTSPQAAAPYSSVAQVVTDGTNFYVCVSNLTGPNGTYTAQVYKVQASDGATLWTTTLTGCYQNAGVRVAYLSGAGQLYVGSIGYGYSAVLNTTTGAVEGTGDIAGGGVYAVADGGSLTLGAETIGTTTGSAPVNVLIGVSNGNLKVEYGGQFRSVTGGTSALSSTAPRIAAAAFGEYIWLSDGATYLKYRPTDNVASAWTATYGTMPADTANRTARLLAVYRNRMAFAGLPGDPFNLYLSATDDPTDLEYGGGVSLEPTDAVAVHFEDAINAVIPATRDVLILGCANSIQFLQGDPNLGGQKDIVTRSTGMAFGDAWCMDPYGAIYFMSNYGRVFRMQPGSLPEPISQQIDGELRDIDLSKVIVRLLWDDQFQRVHVFATKSASAQAATHFIYELRSGSWWKQTFANNNHNPTCVHNLPSTTGGSVAIIGSWDGYVRTFDANATSDDGTAVSSRVLIGPVATPNFEEITLKRIMADMGSDSGTVNWRVLFGATAEIAQASTAVASGTWGSGRNSAQPVRKSGHFFYLDLQGSGYWSMETISAEYKSRGKIRQRGR